MQTRLVNDVEDLAEKHIHAASPLLHDCEDAKCAANGKDEGKSQKEKNQSCDDGDEKGHGRCTSI